MRHGGPGILMAGVGLYVFLLWRAGEVWLPHGRFVKRNEHPRIYWSIMAALCMAFLAAAYFEVWVLLRHMLTSG